MKTDSALAAAALRLTEYWSVEITAKDADRLAEAADLIPAGTKIPITFLPGETLEQRVAAARRVKDLGYIPIPHISARRLHSQQELVDFLGALQREVGIDHAFVVAGDPPQPLGPFQDSLSLVRTGLLAANGIRKVGISGYPEGHPEIGSDALWEAKRAKRDALLEQGHDFAVVTQFGFDAEPMLNWAANVRKAGIDVTIRMGIPGPASVKRLLAFASRCGVGASAKVMRKYGLSIGKLLTTAGPDRLVLDLARSYDPDVHGEVLLHLYPFGGIRAAAQWMQDFRAQQTVALNS